MNDENINNQPVINQNAEQNETEELSKLDAITGIFTEPGETFETISRNKTRNYWLIPVLIMVVAGIVSSFLFFRDAELVDKIMDKQKQKLRERMEENVKSGKMSKEQSNEAIERAEKFMDPKSVIFQITGYSGAVFSPFFILFLLSLIYVIALKIMKAPFVYTNLLNIIGLSMVINAIGGIVSIVLSIVMGDFVSLGLSLVIKESAVGINLHTLLTKLDVFSIWFYVLISIGLSRISGIKQGTSYGVVFGIWIVYLIVTSFVFNSMF